MTSAYTYFIQYYLPLIVNDLHIYAFTLFHAQPLLFFITASLLFIPSEVILFYFNISQSYIFIALDYLWSTIFQLHTNINIGYIVHIDENRDIIFDFSYESEDDLEDESEHNIARIAQQDIARLHRIANIHHQLTCPESFSQLFPSDTEIEDIEITNADYENIDEDINYDLDDYDCSNFPEDY